MSRNYDNWERLVAAAIKKQQFHAMALAPPSSESSFSSSQISDRLASFGSSSDNHDEVFQQQVRNSSTGASPVGIAARAVLLFAAPLAFYRRRKQQDHSFDFCAETYLGHLERFSLLELQVATDSFSNENIVGRNVYKGQLADSTLVAVKRLTKVVTQGGSDLQFQMEVETISLAVHPNVLKLRGFCMTNTEKLLVYLYMANGSVASWLRERPVSQPPLDWSIRKQIALGSARGVAYLNDRSLKIIHRDVKAANIYLDEDFEAVVDDFGSAIVMGNEETHVATTVRGTIGYIDPQYLSTGKVSAKTDVYGYGVMLLELITGHKALACVVNDEQVFLLDKIRGLVKEKKFEMLVDTDLKSDYIDEEVEQLIQVALLCMQSSLNKRPNMSDVVWMLQGYGLAERWREFIFTQYTVNDNMDADELSGPVVDGATGATPVGLAARAALLFASPTVSFWRRKQQDHSLDFPGPFGAADDEPLPGMEGLQISGEAFPGSQLQACGYSTNGTTSCNFEWVRHLEDGSFNYVDGAKHFNYLITADDIGTYLAIEVQPLDERKRKGELVKVFANEHRKITCDPEMQTCIANTYYRGHASFEVSLSTGYFDIWEPAMLAIERNGYTIKCSRPSSVIVTSKFSSSTIVSIPSGSPTEFSIVDPQGNESNLKVDDNSLINNSRDTIVQTLRLFMKTKSGQKKSGEDPLLYYCV